MFVFCISISTQAHTQNLFCSSSKFPGTIVLILFNKDYLALQSNKMNLCNKTKLNRILNLLHPNFNYTVKFHKQKVWNTNLNIQNNTLS